jgi:hypothetical protein
MTMSNSKGPGSANNEPAEADDRAVLRLARVLDAWPFSAPGRLTSSIISRRPAEALLVLPVLAVLILFVALMMVPTDTRAAVITVNCNDNDTACVGCTLYNAIVSHNTRTAYPFGRCRAGSGDDIIDILVDKIVRPGGTLPPIRETNRQTNKVLIRSDKNSLVDLVGTYFTVEQESTLELDNIAITVGAEGARNARSLITNNGGTVIIDDGNFTNNGIDPPSSGGVIANYQGRVIIRKLHSSVRPTVVLHDSVARQGGAIYNDGGTVTFESRTKPEINGDAECEGNSALDGSCIFTRDGTVSITSRVLIHSNQGQKGGRGGALAAENSRITIAGALLAANKEPNNLGSGGLGGAIYLDSRSVLNFSDGGCTDNHARLGGCIYSEGGLVTLDNMNCTTNFALEGGCVRTGPAVGGRLAISNSGIIRNQATSVSLGGGLFIENTAVTITSSLIARNGAGVYRDGGSGAGGGIFGITTNHASPTEITMVGTTLADNTASNLGAGIELENFSSLTAVNSTFANQGPANDPVHGLHFNNSFVNLISTTLSLAPLSVEGVVEGEVRNSILADSGLCVGNIFDGGHNLQFPAPGAGCGTSIPVLDPKLDPHGLEDNGGPTPTIALLPDSPAIDVVPLMECTDQNGQPLTTDQRGAPRPAPGHHACDSGAYEYQDAAVSPPAQN